MPTDHSIKYQTQIASNWRNPDQGENVITDLVATDGGFSVSPDDRYVVVRSARGDLPGRETDGGDEHTPPASVRGARRAPRRATRDRTSTRLWWEELGDATWRERRPAAAAPVSKSA